MLPGLAGLPAKQQRLEPRQAQPEPCKAAAVWQRHLREGLLGC